MPNSVQTKHANRGSTKRKHAETESANGDATAAAATEPDIRSEYRASVLKKGRRACNECRQQKLRCNVKQNPFVSCTRCRRQKLECKIDLAFRRVGKRSRVVEIEQRLLQLEHENKELRSIVGLDDAQISGLLAKRTFANDTSLNSPQSLPSNSQMGDVEDSDEAVASLLHLRNYHDGRSMEKWSGDATATRWLESICLQPDRIRRLFEEYFAHYHAHLPLLYPELSPNQYYDLSSLLFWTIILVSSRRFEDERQLFQTLCEPLSRLLWTTLSTVPQNYHVVKALCLLCTWPMPTSRTSTDPTFMYAGIASQIAIQVGLHRPSHAQDFSRYRLQLQQEDVEDRARTWAVCVIVTQSVSTGYGQPCSMPSVLQDIAETDDAEHVLSPLKEIDQRLKIAELCAKVTSLLYVNVVGDKSHQQSSRSIIVKSLALELRNLETRLGIDSQELSGLHIAAAALHLRLFVFFEPSCSTNYLVDLTELYLAAIKFLDCVFNLSDKDYAIKYATNYIMQMLLAAGYTLYRLLNSFFASLVSGDDGKDYFRRAIRTIREMSLAHNDLPMRLAEVLAQLWRAKVSVSAIRTGEAASSSDIDSSLQLKVRCRMSMSLVYDSVWRWREIFKSVDLESAIENPTDLDDPFTDVARPNFRETSNTMSLVPNTNLSSVSSVLNDVSTEMTVPNTDGYDVFDSLGWVLDGFLDFPFQDNVGCDHNAYL